MTTHAIMSIAIVGVSRAAAAASLFFRLLLAFPADILAVAFQVSDAVQVDDLQCRRHNIIAVIRFLLNCSGCCLAGKLRGLRGLAAGGNMQKNQRQW